MQVQGDMRTKYGPSVFNTCDQTDDCHRLFTTGHGTVSSHPPFFLNSFLYFR